MAIPKETLRIVVAQNSYRMANRLRQVLVLADYQARSIFEAIEANELIEILRREAPIHLAMLTSAMVTEFERTQLHETLCQEFPEVALLYLRGEGDQDSQQSGTRLLPDHVLVPPVTAESFDEAISQALLKRRRRNLAAEYIAQGKAVLKQGEVEQAQSKFESAIRAGGPDPYPAYTLGELFNTLGNNAQAIQYFMLAWEQDSSFVGAIHRVIELLIASGERSKAMPHLERMAQQGAATVGNMVLLAALYIESGLIDKARAAVESSCDRKMPEALAAIQEEVRWFLKHGRLEEAVSLLRIGIDVRPENTHLYEALGDLYMEQNSPREALVCYDNLIRLGKPTSANYCRLARVYKTLGFSLRAEKAVQEALNLDPECTEAAQLRITVAV